VFRRIRGLPIFKAALGAMNLKSLKNIGLMISQHNKLTDLTNKFWSVDFDAVSAKKKFNFSKVILVK